MKKKFILSAFTILLASLLAVAQSGPQARPSSKPSPANKTMKVEKAQKKDGAAKVEHAEKRSDGAAYSGRGKGGDKNTVEKGKRGKGKAKGHMKGQHKGKAKGKMKHKKKDKAYKKWDSKNDRKSKDYEGHDGKPEGTKTRKSERTEQGNTPREQTPTTNPNRRPGDRPAPGKEIKKDQKQRG